MITSTGSNIVDKDFNGIRRLEIDRNLMDQIVKLIKPRGNRISIDIDGVINVFEEMDYPGEYNVITGMDVYGYDPFMSVDAAWRLSKDVHHVTNLDDICRECDYITIHVPAMDATKGMVHGCGIHCETLEEAAAMTAELNEKFGEYLNAFQNVIEVDLAPKGCSKGAGVEAIRRYFGDCKVYGIGDSLNDLPLLLASDVSYTFPYAPEEVQRQVTKVVPTIVEALEDSMQDEI